MKFTLVLIALVDIAMGVAAIGVGVILQVHGDLNISIALNILVNVASLVMGAVALYGIAK